MYEKLLSQTDELFFRGNITLSPSEPIVKPIKILFDSLTVSHTKQGGEFSFSSKNYPLNKIVNINLDLANYNYNYIIVDSFALLDFSLQKNNVLNINLLAKHLYYKNYQSIKDSLIKHKNRFNDVLIKSWQDSLGILSKTPEPDSKKLKEVYNKINNLYEQNKKFNNFFNSIARNLARNLADNFQKYINKFIEGDWLTLSQEIDEIYWENRFNTLAKIVDSLKNKLYEKNNKQLYNKWHSLNLEKEEALSILLLKARSFILINKFDSANLIYKTCILLDHSKIFTLKEYIDLEQDLQVFNDHDYFLNIYEDYYRLLANKNPDKYLAEFNFALFNLGKIYFNHQDYDMSIQFYLKCLDLQNNLIKIKGNGFQQDLPLILTSLGDAYFYDNKGDNALYYYLETITVASNLLKDTINPIYNLMIVQNLNKIAEIYFIKKDDFFQAKSYVLESIQRATELINIMPIEVLPILSTLYNSLAEINLKIGNYDETEDAFKLCLEVRQKLANLNPESYLPFYTFTLNNLALFYAQTNKLDSSLSYFNQALLKMQELQQNTGNFSNDIAQIYHNLGNVYAQLQDPKSTIKYYQKCLDIREELMDKNDKAYKGILGENYLKFGTTLTEFNFFTIANNYLHRAVYLFTNNNDSDYNYSFQLSEAYLQLAQINLKLQNDSMLYYINQSLKLKQDLFSKDSTLLVNLAWTYLQAGLMSKELGLLQLAIDRTKTSILLYTKANNDSDIFTNLRAKLYGNLSYYYILNTNWESGIQAAAKGLSIDSQEDWIYTNLLSGQFLSGKFKDEFIFSQYKKYAGKFSDANKEYFFVMFLNDFNEFKTLNIIPENKQKMVKKITKYLNKINNIINKTNEKNIK